MLGLYENFPKNIHKITTFSTSFSKKKLQQSIINTFYKLNNQPFSLEDVTKLPIYECVVIFEVGLAERNVFNYLDNEEKVRTLKSLQKTMLDVIDAFFVIRYYKKKTRLKFDYYMLRFTFNKKKIQIQVFHERGPRHISPEEILNWITNKVNEQIGKKILRRAQV